mmetsp:Transcript_25648/g.59762  ORF Transcript_25648/g.59762 Transcript_25648/m.59762 type:complete len:356 (-) Transcript_25648:85-1152(-)
MRNFARVGFKFHSMASKGFASAAGPNRDAPVLVTGASGYMARNVIRRLQDRGFRVRGTVRSLKDPSKVAELHETFPELELVEADLLGGPEAYEQAMKGCVYVQHCASPFRNVVENPQEDLIDPAVKGTEAVMKAAVKAGISRVVLTSSVAAVGPPQPWFKEPYELELLTPETWNTTSTLTDGPYRLSKRMAEEKAWEIAKSCPDLELVTICPALVIGPMIGGRADGTSVQLITDLLDGTMKAKGCPAMCRSVVDVRDIAHCHVAAMESPEAAGKRFIVSSDDSLTDVEMADRLRECKNPSFEAYELPLDGPRPTYRCYYDCSLAKQILGFSPIPASISLRDMAVAALRNGLVAAK